MLKYQLGYPDVMRCTNTRLVTCGVWLEYRRATEDLHVRAHRCSSSELPDSAGPSADGSAPSPTPPDGVTDDALGRPGEDDDSASAGPPWDGEGRGNPLDDFGDLLH